MSNFKYITNTVADIFWNCVHSNIKASGSSAGFANFLQVYSDNIEFVRQTLDYGLITAIAILDRPPVDVNKYSKKLQRNMRWGVEKEYLEKYSDYTSGYIMSAEKVTSSMFMKLNKLLVQPQSYRETKIGVCFGHIEVQDIEQEIKRLNTSIWAEYPYSCLEFKFPSIPGDYSLVLMQPIKGLMEKFRHIDTGIKDSALPIGIMGFINDARIYHHLLQYSALKERNVPNFGLLGDLSLLDYKEPLEITDKGVKGNNSSIEFIKFMGKIDQYFNTIKGNMSDIQDAFLERPALFTNGWEPAVNILSQIGFKTNISDKSKAMIEKNKKRFQHLMIPMFPVDGHKALAYYHKGEYICDETVTYKGLTISKGDKCEITPAWHRVRKESPIKVEYDAHHKIKNKVKANIDKGYLVFIVDTPVGRVKFREHNISEIDTFITAFKPPVIDDIYAQYPELVNSWGKKLIKMCPKMVSNPKFAYQVDYVARAAMKNNVLFALDMGLGKTVSAAAWAKIRGYHRVLVVAPTGLVENWAQELGEFGFNFKRLLSYDDLFALKTEKRNKIKLSETTFYITSYDFISATGAKVYDTWTCHKENKAGDIIHIVDNINTERCPICNCQNIPLRKQCPSCMAESPKWSGFYCSKCGYSTTSYTTGSGRAPVYKRIKKLFNCIIVDEAQMAKSGNTQRGVAVHALRAKSRAILSGTPMKGYITDLYHNVAWLLGWYNPMFPYRYHGGMGEFSQKFGTFKTREVVNNQDERIKINKGMIPEVSNVNHLIRMLSPFMIRKLKKNVMTSLLPKKIHKIVMPLNKEHADFYEKYDTFIGDNINRHLNYAKATGTNPNTSIIAGYLWMLRIAATCPIDYKHLHRDGYPKEFYYSASWEKIDKIVEIAREVGNRGEKMVIFTGLQNMVGVIKKALSKENITHMNITATCPAKNRVGQVNMFNHNDVTVLITTIGILNHGFTITGANNCVITDIDWTPETTLQAEDRLHRPGQEKEVNVYYLLGDGTIDMRMLEIATEKESAISHSIDGVLTHGIDVSKAGDENNFIKIAKSIAASRYVAPISIELPVAEDEKLPVAETIGVGSTFVGACPIVADAEVMSHNIQVATANSNGAMMKIDQIAMDFYKDMELSEKKKRTRIIRKKKDHENGQIVLSF